MQNYLSINEASNMSGLSEDVFVQQYIDSGVISIKVEDGVKSIELSEFLRVFPNAKAKAVNSGNSEVELALKQQKIENLEYQVVQLQRQLEKQSEDYSWLRNKFDSTTLLLEQKLDTSELDKHKQEIKKLSEESVQWEKKYNTLLAANELKTLLKENRELKEKLESLNKVSSTKPSNVVRSEPVAPPAVSASGATPVNNSLQSPSAQVKSSNPVMPTSTSENQYRHQTATLERQSEPVKPKRRKIFGIF
ncbi:hypothetical protein [Aquella oligotrophica]|uniref:Uncharacterized protein n=1 Tax=Aquella oligotrophica TaxID=2067065 RepID=A0A2I7N7E6_9NEIS|nr:hypothetical protein [Aquella oligotrophica]AUR52135.1 hypothetical protein CUN60_07415 [Aquella oligotrophica]